MSSLADLPGVVGFFSYSREDDEAFEGTLSALRDAIQRELSAQLGRSKTTFRLWQDQKAIAPGKLWEAEIKKAVEQAVFFIPIVTPRAVTSHYCKFEFEAFLAREQALGRTDLVFPLLYIRVPALENEAQWREHPVLSIIGKRQYVDWRPFRHLDVRTTAVREAIDNFCDKIVEALWEPWVSLEERRLQEAEAKRRATKERKQRAEAARLAEEEKRRAEEEKQRAEAARQAEEEKQRTEAARQAERQKRRAEAARQAEAEMATEVLMPALGETMTEGTLVRWLKSEGEPVRVGDVLAEVETDKATIEIEAVDEGVLSRIVVPEGDHVAVNTPIAVIVMRGPRERGRRKRSSGGPRRRET
jgi:biotin carboxyl carrier protein